MLVGVGRVCGVRGGFVAKIAIEIGALLAWALRDEMPKLDRFLADDGEDWIASRSPWDAMSRLAILGVRVDTSGVVMDDRLPDYPHPDAFVVNEAVQALASAELTMPEGFDALGDCIGLPDSDRAEAHRLGWDIACARWDRLSALVVRRARAGGEPTWRDHGPIYRRPVIGANGKKRWFRVVNEAAGPGLQAVPREVDGYNTKRQRPYPGAYHRYYLDPHPSLLVGERIEYQAWALALRQVGDAVRHRLTDWRLLDAMPPLCPWMGEEWEGGPRILISRVSTGARQEPVAAA